MSRRACTKWPHYARPRVKHHVHRETIAYNRIHGWEDENPPSYTFDGRTYFFKRFEHEGPFFVPEHGHWTESGTLKVTGIGYTESEDLGVAWGSFSIRGGEFGAADGTWVWDFHNEPAGFGLGDGPGGLRVGVTFLGGEPPHDHLPPVPEPPAGEGIIYLRLTR